MAMIADILLVAGALAAGFYCFVLSRRLTEFKNAEGGIAHAVSVLSAQVDEMTATVSSARAAAQDSSGTLMEMTERAEGVAQRLELLLASMHDLPPAQKPVQPDAQPIFAARRSKVAER